LKQQNFNNITMQQSKVFQNVHVSKPSFVNIVALDEYADEEVREKDSYEECITSSAFGVSLNVASLLQCERETFLQQACIESLAIKSLQMLCDSPKSTCIAVHAKKRVTKALSGGTRSYKKENKDRRQIKFVVNGKMGPLPPPPTLVSLKQWQKLKLQLNPNKPQDWSSS
jgi:hypothetical protein